MTNKQKIYLPENVKHLRMRQKCSQEEFAAKAGITRSKLALIEMGKTVNPPLEDVVNLAVLFRIGVDSLLRVDLSKLSEQRLRDLEEGNDSYAIGTNIRVFATTVDSENNTNVELVPEKAKAGYRTGLSDPEWVAELPRYTIPGLSRHSKHRIFPISGDSMLPYPDGCYIVGEFVEDWMNLKSDTLCILILKSGGADFVFKQVENRLKSEKTFLAKSLNVSYEPFEVAVEDVLEIWKYKLHIAGSISCPVADVSNERLFRMMQEIKLDFHAMSKSVSKM